MGAFWGIFKYLIIVVLIAFAGVIVACGALVLFPGFSIFGMHYITGGSTQEVKTIELSSSEFNNASVVRFETKSIDVYVGTVKPEQAYHDSNITVEFYHRLSGFVWGDVEFPAIRDAETITENGVKILLIKLDEPDGVMFKTDVKMVVNVSTTAFANKDIEIVSNSGAAYIGDALTFDKNDSTKLTSSITKLKNVSIKNGGGLASLRSCELNGELRVNKTSGELKVGRDLMKDTYIEITDGLGKITLKNIGSTSNTANLILGNVKNSDIQLGNIYGDMILVADGGLLRMNTIQGEMSITSNACDINMKRVNKNLVVDGGDGKIDIERVVGNVTINQTAGSVSIDEIGGVVDVETTRGNINLPLIHKNAKLYSTYGAITVSGNGSNVFDLNIQSQSGAVNVSKLLGTINYKVIKNGSASVTVEFLKISGINNIQNEVGKIEINVVPAQTDYYLEWSTTKSANININGFVSFDRTGAKGMGVSTVKDDYANQIILSSVVGNIKVIRSV